MIRTVEGLRNFKKFTEIHQNNYFVEHVWILIWKYQIFITGLMILYMLIFVLSKSNWKRFYSLSFGSFMNHQVILSKEKETLA